MTSRFKEDEKNERTIRNLLKLPANKKCINCNSLGPQYVCTNFWTFVCTTCSGIHREFTHRVKSVSMAKFTSQEVVALQSGGNELARNIYFKDWDSQRHSYPNNGNVERLRDFIRHVYVDRRFSGEKSSEKPPRGDDAYENMSDTFRGGSRSPPYEDTYNHRRNDRPSPAGRSDDSFSRYDEKSPGHDRESRHSSDHGRIPGRGEVVNDWRREDRFSGTRKPEDSKTSDGDSLSEGRSPDHQKDIQMSSPVVRPVREILRDNVTPPKIDPPKQNGIRVADAPIHVARTVSSTSFGILDGNQLEPKRETLGSLIDFDADPDPPAAVVATMSQVEQTSSFVTTAQPTNSIPNNNWASFDFPTESEGSKVQASSSNNFDSLFEQLTTPSFAPAQSGQPQNFANPMFASGGPMPLFTAEGSTAVPVSSVSAINNSSVSRSGSDPQHQQQQPSFPTGGSHIHSSQQISSFPAAQILPYVSRPAQEDDFEKQSQKAETKSSGRSALPEDLFAATYHPSLDAHQGWHTSGPAGVGFAMQYSVPAPNHNIQQPSKSANPFDFGNDSAAPEHAFPSMASVHSALPTFSQKPAGLVHSSSVAVPPAYMQYRLSSYTSQDSSYIAGEYFGHQVPQSMSAIRPQGVVRAAGSSFFGSTNQNQSMGGGYAAPAAPNPYPSAGGNPFG